MDLKKFKMDSTSFDSFVLVFFVFSLFYFFSSHKKYQAKVEVKNETEMREYLQNERIKRSMNTDIAKKWRMPEFPEQYAKDCIVAHGFRIKRLTSNCDEKFIRFEFLLEKNEDSSFEHLIKDMPGKVKFVESGKHIKMSWIVSNKLPFNPNLKISTIKKHVVNSFEIDALVYNSCTNWQVWINGTLYDQDNRNIDVACEIIEVKPDYLRIKQNDKLIKIVLPL